MRAFMAGSWLLALGLAGVGCSSAGGAKPAADLVPADYTKACTLPSGGTDVLKVMAPADSKTGIEPDGALDIHPAKFEVEIWAGSGVSTVDDEVKKLDGQIASQFKNFKPTETTDLMIAGSPAKRLVGAGNEADDGDDGVADVIVFKVGDHVFLACTHGEKLSPDEHRALLSVVQTAGKP